MFLSLLFGQPLYEILNFLKSSIFFCYKRKLGIWQANLIKTVSGVFGLAKAIETADLMNSKIWNMGGVVTYTNFQGNFGWGIDAAKHLRKGVQSGDLAIHLSNRRFKYLPSNRWLKFICAQIQFELFVSRWTVEPTAWYRFVGMPLGPKKLFSENFDPIQKHFSEWIGQAGTLQVVNSFPLHWQWSPRSGYLALGLN